MIVFLMMKVGASILEGKSDIAMSTLTEIVEDLVIFRLSLCLRDMGATSLPVEIQMEVYTPRYR
jgi:hypothetical protein